jgi:hypothetical protein
MRASLRHVTQGRQNDGGRGEPRGYKTGASSRTPKRGAPNRSVRAARPSPRHSGQEGAVTRKNWLVAERLLSVRGDCGVRRFGLKAHSQDWLCH